VLFLAVASLLGYMMTGNMRAVIFFILTGYIVSVFNKNMIVIITTPLLLTSILMVGSHIKEGLENATPTVEEPAIEEPAKEGPFGYCPGTKTNRDDESGTNCPKETISSSLTQAASDIAGPPPLGAPDSTKVGEPMTTMYKKNDNRIDYAATVEDAYDDLNKILGGDGIKRLTDDTQKLMGQQLQLAEAMKGMSPLLNQAKQLLSGFDLKNLDGIAGMAKSLMTKGMGK